MNSQQKQYLITLVKHDLECLEQLAADDPKTWLKDYKTAQSTMVMLCGGAK